MPVPPKKVRANAARGLELRREFGRGGTAIGVARARDLSAGKDIPIETINRMISYFARHEVDKDGKDWSNRSSPSAGKIAWLLWGGDEGRAWALSQRMDGAHGRYESVRFDNEAMPERLRAILEPPRQVPGGWIVQGIAATAGVKEYPWGRELAPWPALKARVDAYKGLMLTDGHPGVVSADAPYTGSEVVLGAEAVDSVQAIKVELRLDELPFDRPGLSVGYHPVEIERTPGQTAAGDRYDAIQSVLTPNHVAKTPAPRSKGAGVRLDEKVEKMPKVKINGIEFEVDAGLAFAITQAAAQNKARLDELEAASATKDGQITDLSATVATKNGEIAALQAARMDEAQIEALVQERVEVKLIASKVLGADTRHDGKTVAELKAAAVKAAFGLELEGPSLDGAFAVLKSRQDGGVKPDLERQIDGATVAGNGRNDGIETVKGALKSNSLDGDWLKKGPAKA